MFPGVVGPRYWAIDGAHFLAKDMRPDPTRYAAKWAPGRQQGAAQRNMKNPEGTTKNWTEFGIKIIWWLGMLYIYI